MGAPKGNTNAARNHLNKIAPAPTRKPVASLLDRARANVNKRVAVAKSSMATNQKIHTAKAKAKVATNLSDKATTKGVDAVFKGFDAQEKSFTGRTEALASETMDRVRSNYKSEIGRITANAPYNSTRDTTVQTAIATNRFLAADRKAFEAWDKAYSAKKRSPEAAITNKAMTTYNRASKISDKAETLRATTKGMKYLNPFTGRPL